MREILKPLAWVGDSLQQVRAFSQPVRQQAGYELELVQHGLAPSDWRPMPIVGRGVNEIRIHAGGERRVFYLARLRRAIYVLHAFQKKSRRTAKADIVLGRARLQEALRMEARNR